MIVTKEDYYKILKQISIKLKGNNQHLWIGSVLTDIGLDKFKDYSREITQHLEARGFVSTTNIHDGHKLIVGLLPAALAFIQEYQSKKNIANKSERTPRKWVDKIPGFLEPICVSIISGIIIWLFTSSF